MRRSNVNPSGERFNVLDRANFSDEGPLERPSATPSGTSVQTDAISASQNKLAAMSALKAALLPGNGASASAYRDDTSPGTITGVGNSFGKDEPSLHDLADRMHPVKKDWDTEL